MALDLNGFLMAVISSWFRLDRLRLCRVILMPNSKISLIFGPTVISRMPCLWFNPPLIGVYSYKGLVLAWSCVALKLFQAYGM